MLMITHKQRAFSIGDQPWLLTQMLRYFFPIYMYLLPIPVYMRKGKLKGIVEII